MGLSYLGVILGDIAQTEVRIHAKNPMRTQRRILRRVIRQNKRTVYGKKYDFSKVKTIEDYQKMVPLTTYPDYADYIERGILNKEKNLITSRYIWRYCSSSGSVGKPKILPKGTRDLWNMQCLGFSASVGCTHSYLKAHNKKFPDQMGPIVMVLTGHRLEDGKMVNGAGQIPVSVLKPITPFFTTSPHDILFPEHEELLDISYFQLRFALQNEKVSYIGSLVITLLTTMFDYLENNWEMMCYDIEHGTINENVKMTDEYRKKYTKKFKPMPERAAALRKEFEKGFEDPIAPRIWPRLTWAYGMVGSNLEIYVKKLRRYIGEDVPLHNMGYASAEGYFAVPVELNAKDYALVPYCVFFEFLPLDAPDGMTPLTMDQIEVGKEYEMIITNHSGLYRYRLEDVVKVTGMLNNSPKVEFMYRLNLGMNIANEKTSTQMIDWCAKEISVATEMDLEGHSFYEDYSSTPPHYIMLAETRFPVDISEEAKYAKVLDEKMEECNEKYAKYRRWGMIGDPEVLFVEPGTYNAYREMLRGRGVVLNQIKPVTVINNPERKEFFFSHVIRKDK